MQHFSFMSVNSSILCPSFRFFFPSYFHTLTCPWDGNHLGRTGRLGQINTQISILPVSNWDMKKFGPF